MKIKDLKNVDVCEVFYKKYIPIIVYFIAMFLLHMRPETPEADDATVYEMLKEHFWQELISPVEICQGWSSRVLINPAIHAMMHFDYRVWIVLNMVIMMIIFYMFKKLCVWEDKPSRIYLMTFIILIFPFHIATSVGSVVTSMTYLWPAAAAFYLFYIIKKIFNDEDVRWYTWAIGLFLGLYASNKEELSVMITVIFFTATVLAIKNKKKYLLLLAIGVEALGSIFFHLLSTGNQDRFEELSLDYATEYTSLQKVIIGVWATLKHCVFQYDFVFFCVLVVLAFSVWTKSKLVVPRLVCVLPLVIWCIAGSLEKVSVAVVIIVGVITVLLILATIYYLYGITDKTIMIWALLVAAFAGRTVVGFANHGWQAFERTYVFLDYSLLMVAIMASGDMWNHMDSKNKKCLLFITSVMAVISVFKSIVEIGFLI